MAVLILESGENIGQIGTVALAEGMKMEPFDTCRQSFGKFIGTLTEPGAGYTGVINVCLYDTAMRIDSESDTDMAVRSLNKGTEFLILSQRVERDMTATGQKLRKRSIGVNGAIGMHVVTKIVQGKTHFVQRTRRRSLKIFRYHRECFPQGIRFEGHDYLDSGPLRN